jgi:hypothetical protein
MQVEIFYCDVKRYILNLFLLLPKSSLYDCVPCQCIYLIFLEPSGFSGPPCSDVVLDALGPVLLVLLGVGDVNLKEEPG